MCARFTLTSPPNLIAELFDLDLLVDVGPRFNVAPTQDVLTVRSTPDGDPEFARLRWGLVPSWAQDPTIGSKLLNARSETVGEKPSFRDAIRKRRCLIPADGFFEWKSERGAKRPYFVHLPGRQPFAFAGIWERWQGHDGKALETCSILTTAANELLRPLHERMPVILEKCDFARWLDPSLTKLEDLQPLLKPLPAEALRLYPVSPRANNARFDDPVCVEPVNEGPPRPRQRSLFSEDE
jgi:putative SOS response-associated peptidase YedK